MSVDISRMRMRMYKAEFDEKTKTPEGRESVANYLLSNQAKEPRFTREEVIEIVNNNLPPKQQPWPVEKVIQNKIVEKKKKSV